MNNKKFLGSTIMLVGIGLMSGGYNFIGIIVFIVGVSIVLKYWEKK